MEGVEVVGEWWDFVIREYSGGGQESGGVLGGFRRSGGL